MTVEPLDPKQISLIKRARTVVFHQYPDRLEGEMVLYNAVPGSAYDSTISFAVDNGGVSYASGWASTEEGEVNHLRPLVEVAKDVRIVSKLEQFDEGVSATIKSLLRQGDTLRLYNRVGYLNNVHLTAAGLLSVECFLIIKRRARATDGPGGGRELRFLLQVGYVRPADVQLFGCIAP